jgi:PKD repeat protein
MVKLNHIAFSIALLLLAVASCSGGTATGPVTGAQLEILDAAGVPLPHTAARLEATSDGYAIYALDGSAAGFRLSYGGELRLLQLHRGEYFADGDLFLAVSSRPGRVDVGGYRFSSAEVAPGGVLVARVALAGGGGDQRTLSALPTGASSEPLNFGYVDNGDDSATFSWTYHNTGDYDQNGEVNISDLTPIGMHIGKSSDDGDWTAAGLADGDNNGEVNISDVTPIGQFYGIAISGYKLERGLNQAGPYAEAATVALSSGAADPVRSFSYTDAGAADGDWYRVRAYSVEDPTVGAATDALRITLLPPGGAPVANFTFAPAAPVAGESVQFTDTSTGAPTDWGWDFGDGGSSNLPSPSHTYADPGTFTATLTASNAFGARQASYLVVVGAAPVEDDPANTFVAESSATLNAGGTAFDINSTDLPDGIDILFGPLTQGMQPVDNNLVLTYPYRGGLNEPAAVHPNIQKKLGTIGMTVAGIVIYGPSNASTITRNGSTFSYDANAAKINGEDSYGGHASQVNGGQYHYHDVAFITNNAWVGVEGFDGVYTWPDGHSKLIGWAEDGYPIYGPFGYVNPLDSSSGVEQMTGSWESTNTAANRPPAVMTTSASAASNSRYVVLGSDPAGMGIDPGMRITEIDGVAPAEELYIMNQKNVNYVGGGRPPYTGPNNSVELNRNVTIAAGADIKFEFLPGCFIEDNVYVGGGSLDRYNGRFGVTPDYPGGTYAYFCTMSDDGHGHYPYMIGPELYGSNVVGGTPGTGYVNPAP